MFPTSWRPLCQKDPTDGNGQFWHTRAPQNLILLDEGTVMTSVHGPLAKMVVGTPEHSKSWFGYRVVCLKKSCASITSSDGSGSSTSWIAYVEKGWSWGVQIGIASMRSTFAPRTTPMFERAHVYALAVYPPGWRKGNHHEVAQG